MEDTLIQASKFAAIPVYLMAAFNTNTLLDHDASVAARFLTILLLCGRCPKHPSKILHTALSVLVSHCLLKAGPPPASQCIRIDHEKSLSFNQTVSTRALSL